LCSWWENKNPTCAERVAGLMLAGNKLELEGEGTKRWCIQERNPLYKGNTYRNASDKPYGGPRLGGCKYFQPVVVVKESGIHTLI